MALAKPILRGVKYGQNIARNKVYLPRLDLTVPVGLDQVQMTMDIKADGSDDDINELWAFAKNHSPVCSTVCRPIPVTVKKNSVVSHCRASHQ